MVAAGFDPGGDYLLTTTHSGRGVFSTRILERRGRSTDLAYPELGIGVGIGPIDDQALPVTEMEYGLATMRVVSPDGRIVLECESSGIALRVADP